MPRMVADFAAGRLQPFYRCKPVSLAGLPIPDRRLVRRHAYVPLEPIQATRGCYQHCSFCSVAAFSQYQLRTRPVEEVIAELRTLGPRVIFLDDNITGNIETLQATRMTPFPGTSLFAEMECQGRITDHDWSHYDFNHVVYEPRQMGRETLSRGVSWVLREFLRPRQVARRLWRCFGYLDPRLVVEAVLPMNLGYIGRLTLDGNLARGEGFAVPAAAAAESGPRSTQ